MKLRLLIASMILLTCVSPSASADEAPNNQPSPRLLKRRAYIKKMMVEAYDRGGEHDPRWDAPAREALLALSRLVINDPLSTGDEESIILTKSVQAVRAGCQDGLVRYCEAMAMGRANAPRAFQVIEKSEAAKKILQQTQYPPYIRVQVLLYGAWCHLGERDDQNPKWRKESSEYLQQAMRLFPDVFADRDAPPELLIGLVESMGRLSVSIANDRMVLVEPVIKLLAQSPQSKSLRLTAQGSQMILYAWDARGNDWAINVAADQWPRFKERIAQARALLEEAWQLDEHNCDAANEMLIIVKAESRPRDEMEVWFKRAMALDSCNRRACLNKIDYLRPAWGGSEQDMLDFGQELVDGGNPAGGLPIQVENIHWQIAQLAAAANGNIPDRAWFNHPGVWDQLKEMYEGYLKLVPQSRHHRTRYMLAAAWSGHWDVAEEQLKLLEEHPAENVRPDPDVLEVKRQIHEHAAAR